MRRLASIAAALLLLPAAAARAEHLVLDTPPDWAITTLPAPEVDGHVLAGQRRRAILPGANGRPLAAIEVTELPQTADQTGELAPMLKIAVETAMKGYAADQLDDRCDPPAALQLAGHPALRTDCTIYRGAQPVLGQVIVMLVTPATLFSVTYSAGMANYSTHQQAFGRALGSARIQ